MNGRCAPDGRKRRGAALVAASLLLLSGCAARYAPGTEPAEHSAADDLPVLSSTDAVEPADTTPAEPDSAASEAVDEPTDSSVEDSGTMLPEEISSEIADDELVKIIDYIPSAYIELQYATEHNFTGTVIYDAIIKVDTGR